MPEWIGPAVIGAVITALASVVVAAINKRRTTPERHLDALDGFQKLVQDLQEERDKADGRTREAREDHAADRAALASAESRIRILLAYVEQLRGHIFSGKPPPPPDYPEGMP